MKYFLGKQHVASGERLLFEILEKHIPRHSRVWLHWPSWYDSNLTRSWTLIRQRHTTKTLPFSDGIVKHWWAILNCCTYFLRCIGKHPKKKKIKYKICFCSTCTGKQRIRTNQISCSNPPWRLSHTGLYPRLAWIVCTCPFSGSLENIWYMFILNLLGPYLPTILKNILCLILQDCRVYLNVTQLLIG